MKSQEGIENIHKALLWTKGVCFLHICSLSSRAQCPAATWLLGFSPLAGFFFICKDFTMQGQPFLQWSSWRKQSFRVLWTVLSKPVLEVFLSGRSRWNDSSCMGYSSTKGSLEEFLCFLIAFRFKFCRWLKTSIPSTCISEVGTYPARSSIWCISLSWDLWEVPDHRQERSKHSMKYHLVTKGKSSQQAFAMTWQCQHGCLTSSPCPDSDFTIAWCKRASLPVSGHSPELGLNNHEPQLAWGWRNNWTTTCHKDALFA